MDNKVKKPPVVYKVKDPDPDEKYADIHPHLPQPPSLLLIIGSVKQGKSNLVVNLLCSPEMYKDKFDIVKIISNTLNADPKGKLMNKYFDCEDHYEDSMITDLVESQKLYEDFERPTVALILDDILTKDFKKSNAVSFLATRFRHYGIGLLAFTTQSFRAVSGLIRNNATSVIVMKQQNQKELEKINEEYGDMFAGIFMDLYNKAIDDQPYSFLYLDLSENPAKAYMRFETVIGEGTTKKF
tara:strand:+ start:635 stop:1357 length:723 start_codon:yes stop_codon:yes gene_type:complete